LAQSSKDEKKEEQKEAPTTTPAEVVKPYQPPSKHERKQDIKQAFTGHLKPTKEEKKEGPPVDKVEPSKADL
jgi:hypothetical protein